MSPLRLGSPDMGDDPFSTDEEEGRGNRFFLDARTAMRRDVMGQSAQQPTAPAAPVNFGGSLFAGIAELQSKLEPQKPAAVKQGRSPAEPAPAPKLGGSLFDSIDAMRVPAPVEQEKPTSNSFARGLQSGGIDSAKETVVGAKALLADTVGAKDTATAAFGKYKEMQDEKQKDAQAYESFTNVMDPASKDATFGKFLGYWGGYALGQAAQTVATAVAGAAVGSAAGPVGMAGGAIAGVFERGAAQAGIKAMIKSKLEDQVATEIVKHTAKGLAKDEAEKLAYQAAAKSVFRELGAAAAVTGQNVAMEGASIYGEAREEAEKRGEKVDLGRVWTGTILAAATESAMDIVGIKGMQKAFGGGNLFKNVAVESFKGGLREGTTEAIQTGFERYGASKDLTSAEARRDYVDSAAAGAVGGVLFGGVKGTLKTVRADQDERVKKTIEDAHNSFKKPDQQTGEQGSAPINSAGFVAEPLEQVQAQVDAVREGRKNAVVTGLEEADQVNAEGLQKFQITDPKTGHIAVVFGTDEKLGEQVQARVNEIGLKPAMGEVLGYVEPTNTAEPKEGLVSVQQNDNATGQILQEQAVSPENVANIPAIPDTTTNVTDLGSVLEQRAEGATADQVQPSIAAQTTQQPAIGVAQQSAAVPTPENTAAALTDQTPTATSQVLEDQAAPTQPTAATATATATTPTLQPAVQPTLDAAAQAVATPGSAAAPSAPVEKKAAATKSTQSAQPTDTTKSWVIRNKATGEVVMETFDKAKVDALNTQKYEAVPALQHLQELNEKQKKVQPKPKAAERRKEAMEIWEDNDDGTVAHVAFAKLSKQSQDDWIEATSPEAGEKAYATPEFHDKIVEREAKNARAERVNAKATENKKDIEADFRRKDQQTERDFTYASIKTIDDLNRAVQPALAEGESFKASRVPIGNLVGKVPGISLIQRTADLFGKKVVFFQAEPGSADFFDGAVIPGSSTIFVNVNTSRPHLRVFGHELVHALRNSDPRTYRRLVNNLLPMIDDVGLLEYAIKQSTMGVKNQDKILEEAIGDIVGDRFGEPEFWKMIAEENPTMFKQLADIIMKFIDDTLAKLKGKQSLGSETLINDLTSARQQIAKIVSEYQTQQAQEVSQSQQSEQQVPDFKRVELNETKGFYSALERAFVNPKISLDKTGATSGQQWKAWLNSKKSEMGVKPEEIEWVGINDWFDLNAEEKLTSDQVKQWVAGNRVNVNDVLLRSYGETEMASVAEFIEPDQDTLREFVREQIDSGSVMDDDASGVSPDDMTSGALRQWISENYGWNNFMRQQRRMSERFQQGRIDKMTRPKHGGGSLVLEGGKNYAELVLFDPTIESYARGDDTHFGDVTRGQAIGWLRMNERKDAFGNDVLFIEEIQSKRAQDARKGETVPDAPFMKKTESWTALLLKRAIAYAQQRGIGQIAWTTGEQQNTRYAFPGDELVYVKEKGKDTVTLTVMDGGREIRTVNNIPLASMSAYVGERAAERINANEGVQLDNDIEASGSLKGDDLKVMEANLQPYYNTTVPSVAKKIIEKFDGKVEVMNVTGTGQQLGFVITPKLHEMVAQDGFPMFSRKQYAAQFDDLPQSVQDMAIAKGHYSPPTIKERLEALRPNMWKRVVQGTFDRFRSVKDISLKAYMMLRMSTTVDGAVEGLLHYGQVFNDDGALNLKKGTKGLLEILKPVGNETDRFLLWIAANRAGKLKEQDKERFFTQAEIDALRRLNLGTMKNGKARAAIYAETLVEMNQLNKSVLDIARTNGLINDEAYKRFADDIWYIPFYRQMGEDGSLSAAQSSSGSVGQYLSKKLKGSERQLNDLMENVLMNWSHILSASMKNAAAVETLTAAQQLQGIVTKLVRVDGKIGVDAAGNAYPLKYAVKVMEKGQDSYYNIDDEFLLASLDAVANIPSYGFWTNTAREFKTALTRFISLSPTFKINNLIRDSIQSVGLSELKPNPIMNTIQGWRAYKDERAEALIGGGMFAMGNAYDGDRASNVKRLVRMGVDKADILTTKEKTEAWFRKVGDQYDEISDRFENATRLALYQQLRANKATHLEAAYAARDLQDFSLQGNFSAIRYASMVLPYFNARLQGMYKLGRDGFDPVIATVSGKATDSQRQQAAKFSLTLTAVTSLGLVLYLSQKDDDDWKKREDWDRDAFFWFKIPGTQRAVRIPKPFEMGAFATIVERFTEQLVDPSVEGKVFGKRLLAVLHDNLAINPVPQIVRPLYDIARNKDGFTDRPIESMSAERLSPENRINAGTSSAGVGLGKLNSMFAEFASTVTGGAVTANSMKISPIQYDYMLRGYLGWVGTGILTTSNLATAPFKEGSRPDMKIDNMLVVGNYVKSMPQSQSRYVTSFYENAKQISTAVADYKSFVDAGKAEQAMEVFEAKRDQIALSKLYTRVTERMSEIQKRVLRINEDKEMPGDQKRFEMDRLGQLRVELAKTVEGVRIAKSRGE